VTQFSILAAVARLGEASLKQLEDELAIDQTTLTRSLTLLEGGGVLERASHPDGRIKAMRLTSKGRRALEVARPLWPRRKAKSCASWEQRRGLTRTAVDPAASCRREEATTGREGGRVHSKRRRVVD